MIYTIKKYISHFLKSKHRGHGVHSPFVYSFVKLVIENDGVFYSFKKIENIRNNLLENNKLIDVNDLGAGSKKNKNNKRKISYIAKTSLKPAKQAQFIFKVVNYFSPDNVIELGTSLGITTSYIAFAKKTSNIYTVEGSSEIHKIAQKVFKSLKLNNITAINDNFDNALPKLLEGNISPDLVYIDGNHTYDATMRYFNILLKYVNEKSILIFDDIYWSKDMNKAWNKIKNNNKVTLSIDLFHFGLVFFRNENPKQDFKLFL